MAGVGAPWEAPWGLAREGTEGEGGGGEGGMTRGASLGGGAMGRGGGARSCCSVLSVRGDAPARERRTIRDRGKEKRGREKRKRERKNGKIAKPRIFREEK
jgi:hypothetical protein